MAGGMVAEATTYTAASTSFVDVSNACSLARNGDTVLMPPGTNIWSNQLGAGYSGFGYTFSLKGSGTNVTQIIENAGSLYAPIIVFNPDGGAFAQMSDFTLVGNVAGSSGGGKGCVEILCNSTNWRVHNLVFNQIQDDNLVVYASAFGVIDHCTFYLNTSGSAVKCAGDTMGDFSWSTPPSYGGVSNLFVEDCVFTNLNASNGGDISDTDGGGRVVFRHNTVLNCGFYNHGTETGGRVRSARSFELYNNTFATTNNTFYSQQYADACDLRGGSGVAFSNTLSGYNYFMFLNYYRALDQETSPFYGAWGQSSWDSNSPVVLSVTYSGATSSNNVVTLAGQNWTTNQWVAYTLFDTNTGTFGIIIGNTTNVITTKGARLSAGQLTVNNGDHVQMTLVYPMLDAPGMGSGDLLSGYGAVTNDPVIDTVYGVAHWPNQVVDGIYGWGNTLPGGDANIENNSYPNIQLGRDYFNNTPKPGYAPYVYPHPLVAGSAPGLASVTGILSY